MKKIYRCLLGCLAFLVCFSGCSESRSGKVVAPSSNTEVAAEYDRWLGRWNGPEGTFLHLEGGNGNYHIRIQNLDGPREFQGAVADHGIKFERDGLTQLIRATDGTGTGMKWLAGKSTCLKIVEGEGYCRD